MIVCMIYYWQTVEIIRDHLRTFLDTPFQNLHYRIVLFVLYTFLRNACFFFSVEKMRVYPIKKKDTSQVI